MAQHKLVIAEKPSVAQSLAAVIGATVRKDGYLEGNGWRVSWCVGHLAGLADADSYDPKYAKWRYDDLPILPEHWQMVVGKDKKKQFDILKKLMNAPDVTEVVNACDAGREGELIFRSVYELADCQKPMKRLWIATVYKGNIIKNLIMDCQSYTKYRPNETTGGIFVSWRRKEELPTGA